MAKTVHSPENDVARPRWTARTLEALVVVVTVIVALCALLPAAPALEDVQARSRLDMPDELILPILILQTACIVALLIQSGQRKATQKSLKESQENINFAAHAAKLVLWSWDLQADRVWLSDHNFPALRTVPSGATFEECVRIVHPDDVAAIRSEFDRTIATGAAVELECRVVGDDKRVFWVKLRGRAEVDEVGQAIKISGVAIDVTERKEFEFEASEQREMLTHALRVGLLGELSGAIAHELSQPLAAILSNAQAAQRVLTRTPDNVGELREIVSDIIADDKRARDVISHLRTLLKKGKSELDWLDLNAEVEATLARAQSELIRCRVDVSLELARGLPPVHGDRIQLEQLLLNLIINAAEAMHSDRKRGRLTVTTVLGRDGAPEIAVRDTGPGLNEEAMARIFEPFYSTKSHGLGLGLTICRSIISAHNGQLWAVNNADGGATFYVSFPRLAKEAA